MLKKLLITLIFCLGLGFGFSAQAATSDSCPTDDGLGTGAGAGQYYCYGAFRTGETQCTPTWTGTAVCSDVVAAAGYCPANCATPDRCGYCKTCNAGYSICGGYHTQVCTADTVAPANCSSFNQCSKVCSACAQGYELVGNACTGATLKLGTDSVGAANHLFQSTVPSVFILADGKVGFGTTPLDVFSIGMGGVSAPVGSLGTGHNNTMSYVSTDNYALVNYGTVKSIIASTTSNGLWGGTLNANIWNGAAGLGNVGIGTTNPGQKLQIGDLGSTTNGVNNIMLVGRNSLGYSPVSSLIFSNSNDTLAHTANINMLSGSNNQKTQLQFQTFGTTLATGMTLDENGNVGIGTTAPLMPLQIKNWGGLDGNANQLLIRNNSYYTDTERRLVNGFPTEIQMNNVDGSIVFRNAGTGLADSSFTFSNPMIILNNGNVGIGTTAPNDTLSIGMAGASAPAGSAGTGHNNTMTYAPTDNYALINYGFFKSSTIMASNTSAVVSGGDLNMGGKNILQVNKLNVLTIDPLYNIKGINYSTYAPSISGGVKEECLGKVVLNTRNLNNEYEKIIDFSNEPEGTDLWVWRQVVDFNFENIEVLLTPYGKFANTYYLIEKNKLIFRSDKPITLSYRLIGNRFDWRKWPTKALDQTEKGTMVNLFN